LVNCDILYVLAEPDAIKNWTEATKVAHYYLKGAAVTMSIKVREKKEATFGVPQK
jgi:hypothetical protein